MTCTFFGHRDTPSEIAPLLRQTLIDLIERRDATKFYVGNHGGFDSIVKTTLHELKQVYPHIECAVVLAYLPHKADLSTTADDCLTIYPEGLECSPPKFAIDKRNRWMLAQAECVVTYVRTTFGGAAKFKALAERKHKTVIELATVSSVAVGRHS